MMGLQGKGEDGWAEDHDVRLELPAGSWSRFECRVGVADEVASRWPTQCRARRVVRPI